MCQNLVLRPTFKMIFCLQHSAAGPRSIQWAGRQRNREANRSFNSSASWSPSRWISPCQRSHLTLCSSSLYTCTRSILAVQSKKRESRNRRCDWNGVKLKAVWFQTSYTETYLLPRRLQQISLTVSVLQYMLTQLFQPFNTLCSRPGDCAADWHSVTLMSIT